MDAGSVPSGMNGSKRATNGARHAGCVQCVTLGAAGRYSRLRHRRRGDAGGQHQVTYPVTSARMKAASFRHSQRVHGRRRPLPRCPPRRNPDASRSCGARGSGAPARHGRSAPHGWTGGVVRLAHRGAPHDLRAGRAAVDVAAIAARAQRGGGALRAPRRTSEIETQIRDRRHRQCRLAFRGSASWPSLTPRIATRELGDSA